MSMVRPRSVEVGWTSYFKVDAKSTPITMLDWHNFSSDSDNLSSDSLHKVSKSGETKQTIDYSVYIQSIQK